MKYPSETLAEKFGIAGRSTFLIEGVELKVYIESPGFFSVRSLDPLPEDITLASGSTMKSPYYEGFSKKGQEWVCDFENEYTGIETSSIQKTITRHILEAIDQP
jgi:hypothetical protein